MTDFDTARATMVDCQIRPADVTAHDVLNAFESVPREAFVSPSQRPLAYIDEDILVQQGDAARYMMEPRSFARLVLLDEVSRDCIVLDVGCATGYSTAILSLLSNSVVAVESDETLASQASANLAELSHDNAVVVHSALEDGYAAEGPYDVIFIGGAVDFVPDDLKSQLKDEGRMVVVEGTGNAGRAMVYVREGDVVSGRAIFNCAVKPLPGFEKAAEFAF